MKLYYQSNPSRSGYRKRLHSLWNDAGLFPSSIQRLADQARSVRNNNLLSDIELLEIQGTVSVDMVDFTVNDSNGDTRGAVRTVQNPFPSNHPPETGQAPSVSQRIRDIRHSCASPPLDPPTPTLTTSNTDTEAICICI